jgi:hypothetical protein
MEGKLLVSCVLRRTVGDPAERGDRVTRPLAGPSANP